MRPRPTSVTVISWILIVTGAATLFAIYRTLNNPLTLELMRQNPLPFSVQYGMMYVGLAITVISGIAMLKGKNWARLLYVGWSILGFVIGILTSPVKIMLVPGIILFAVIAFFLFRPKANAFFNGAIEL